MSDRTGSKPGGMTLGSTGTFGTAATSARSQLSVLLSRESLLRMALALVLSTALWLYVTNKQNPGYTEYPQALQVGANAPSGLVVTNALGDVRVTVREDNPNILVTPNSIRATVNLFNYHAGAYTHVPVQVITDPGIHVGKITPAYVPVMLERQLTSHVPVTPNIIAQPPTGYTTGAITIEPNAITVQGPESIVSQVRQARVDLSLSGYRSSFSGSDPPTLVDSQGRQVNIAAGVTITPPQLQVNVPIKALTSYRTVSVLADVDGVPATGYGVNNLVVTPSEITVQGQARILATVKTARTAPISVAHQKRSFTRRVSLRLGHGVTSLTRTVQVTVQMQPVGSSSSIELGVVPTNVPPGLSPHIGPARVLVTVVARSSALAGLAKRMRASINLANVGLGTYQFVPNLTYPPGVTIENIYPSQVTVTMTASGSSP